MTPTTPGVGGGADAAGCAARAAEAVRALNHACQPAAGGLTTPADAYAVAGALALLAARLPQALSQLQAFLDAECDADRIAMVDGEYTGDPLAAVSATGHWLAHASTAAEQLQYALDRAQHTLTWAAAAGPHPGQDN